MDFNDRGHGSSHRTHTDLKPLKSKDDVKRFLKAIREDFLSTVNSKESGLEDILVQNGVLNCDSDVESLRHYPTRKDESRRLWTILCSVDHKIFISSALPALCDKYHHIIPHKFWKGQSQPNGRGSITSQTSGVASENTCIRCAAKRRVREKAMLDLLFGCELMSFDEYSVYTREPLKLNWDLIFKTVHKIHPGKVTRFCEKFQKLLKDYALSVPENLEDSIKDGFPCTCFSQPEVSSSGGRKVSGKQQKQDPWRYYGKKSGRRGSDVSTDTSVYPDSEEDSESYCSSRTCTVRRNSLSSCRSTCSHLPAGMSESNMKISHEHLHPMSRGTQTTSSIVNETKKLRDSLALEVTSISEQKPDNENLDEATANCSDRLIGDGNPPPDDLWKSFKMVDRRLKRRPALKEVFKRMALRTKKRSPGATQELTYSFPKCTCRTENPDVPESELPENETEILHVIKELIDFLTESETEDPDVKEEQTNPSSPLPCAASTNGSSETLGPSSGECGVEETMNDMSVDTSEETAIFMELCDIVTSNFSSNEDVTDPLKTSEDEECVVDSEQSPTLTVSRRRQACVIF